MITLFTSLAFFLSGFAALIYQVAWQRILVLPMGADVYSTTIVVAAFMFGLGFGSLAGGHLADRLTWFQNLVMFVVAELAIGTFGLVSRAVFYDWQYVALSSSATPQAVTIAAVFAGLLWPTFWMGMSLPLLGHAVSRIPDEAAQRVGLLYGVNTLGAAAGAFLSTWVIVPRLGLDGAIRVAAVLNLVAVASVLSLVFGLRQRELVEGPRSAATPPAGGARNPAVMRTGWSFGTWATLYAIAGFQALSLEILWFRLLGVMVKASAFTFGTLLTIYLSGLGLGAALGSAWLHRVRRPALAFLALQAFVGLYAAASIALLVTALDSGSMLTALKHYLAGYEPLDAAAAFRALGGTGSQPANASQFIMMYFLLPAVLVGPATIAMGASFPFLQKVVLVDLERMGRRVGTVLVANIGGAAAGSIVTGWIALTWLGSATSLKALALVSGGFLALAAIVATASWSTRMRALAAGVGVAIAVAVALVAPGEAELWAQLHGSTPPLVLRHEDATGVSLIKEETQNLGSRGVVFVNGIGQSWIPYGNVHSILGALPAFVHADPRSAALIGLGSGDTLYSLAGRQELTHVTSIEIIRPQLQTLREWERRTGYPALTHLLSDPRIEHIDGDGRIYIMRSPRLFDIIEADALRATSAFSGNLYSVGYFELLRSKLAPNGLAVTWSPTSRIRDTFSSVFPHVLAFGDIVLGSTSPIRFDPAEVRARLRTPAVQTYFARAAIDIEALLAPYLDRRPEVIERKPGERGPTDLNHDLFPRDEFSLPRTAR